MKNYRIDLEHVTDNHIEIVDFNTRVTKKAAINLAKKLSSSKKFHKLNGSKNIWGDKGYARVWVYSDESSNEDWEYGRHTMMFENGECTYDTVG